MTNCNPRLPTYPQARQISTSAIGQYEEDVVYHFLVQEDISKDLMELTNGKIKIQYIQDIETECVI